ncbi:uncharacterized protein [Chelonus insularis]|uniref:uncharacterized protein n=1 Tax=Chelonus insularis TaxID=460826 RepID=UPI00158AB355|nr:uncharacterized protein LOC118064874 [Chelonus insularis]XP_034935676.1 uncharacterized protein LOC118064874 [Chelonus insularis]XP_034935677.1 uncharacterized protein LOC118064874 [Chelonus insularis]XP_034935678.1 uncharacterized protein LOC118064874 [Chelonus insularis]
MEIMVIVHSIPCLTDILPEEQLKSYKMLVKSVYTLLSTKITEDELLQCELDLLSFLDDCEKAYGQAFMTFNMHSLSHMPESVRQNGPLWVTSAYPFESNIFHMKQDITGPKGVLSQIANRMLRRNNLQDSISIAPDNDAWNFCKEIINKRKEVSSNFMRSGDGALLINTIRRKSHGNDNTSYTRCIYKGTLFERFVETETKKTDNTVVYFGENIIGRIMNFHLEHNKTYLSVVTFQLKPYDRLNHIFKIEKENNKTEVVPISDVKSKVVYIKVQKLDSTNENTYDEYVCLEPNSIEVQ